jgi:carbamoyl-phosphate synthase large subunit
MNTEKFIHQEYFSPKDYREFTVDLYYDRNSKLRCAVPRLRIATRSGEISKGITVKGNVYSEVLKHFQELPGAIGCITLQVFERKADGKLFGIEINPRFGGGYPLSHLAGANYVDWIIAEYLVNAPIPSFYESWKEDTLLLRYDAEMIVHDYAFPK